MSVSRKWSGGRKTAGIKLCAEIRKNDPFVPLIIQSSESENSSYAAKYGASFIDKNSKKMDVDLRRIVSDNFGFGDFIFRNPDTGEEIARVRNLKELQNILFAVPAESFFVWQKHPLAERKNCFASLHIFRKPRCRLRSVRFRWQQGFHADRSFCRWRCWLL